MCMVWKAFAVTSCCCSWKGINFLSMHVVSHLGAGMGWSIETSMPSERNENGAGRPVPSRASFSGS